MSEIQIFITTYNRPEFIINCVNSILNQTFTDFKLVISDNSTNNLTQLACERFTDNRVSYIKRVPTLSGIEHFNTILSEVSCDYFMIFHDDDIMYVNMVEELVKEFKYNNDSIAIGANAFFLYDNIKTNKLIFKSKLSKLVLRSNLDVAKQYLVRNGIVPFSSFLYKKDVGIKLKLDYNNGLNFCDAAFMMDVASLGQLIYLNKPLMDYYVHTDNNHVPDFFTNNMKFINYIRKSTDSSKNFSIVSKYRIKAIYMELKQGLLTKRIKIGSNRYLKLLKFLFIKSYNDYFPRILVITCLCFLKVSTKKIKVEY
jgi:GT2 family glycosyltransferase